MLPGYEEMYLQPSLLNGVTSGSSPICAYVDDQWPVTHKVFMEIFGWVLYNNGLVLNLPVMLS
jgi:hypothetical protein